MMSKTDKVLDLMDQALDALKVAIDALREVKSLGKDAEQCPEEEPDA
jgi:hypothetical protein